MCTHLTLVQALLLQRIWIVVCICCYLYSLTSLFIDCSTVILKFVVFDWLYYLICKVWYHHFCVKVPLNSNRPYDVFCCFNVESEQARDCRRQCRGLKNWNKKTASLFAKCSSCHSAKLNISSFLVVWPRKMAVCRPITRICQWRYFVHCRKKQSNKCSVVSVTPRQHMKFVVEIIYLCSVVPVSVDFGYLLWVHSAASRSSL